MGPKYGHDDMVPIPSDSHLDVEKPNLVLIFKIINCIFVSFYIDIKYTEKHVRKTHQRL